MPHPTLSPSKPRVRAEAPREASIEEVVLVPLDGLRLSDIRAELNNRDLILAKNAEQSALEGGDGQKWSNADNGHFGEVRLGAPVNRGRARCQTYVHIVHSSTREVKVSTTACRDPSGRWASLGEAR
jgi:surface antigen